MQKPVANETQILAKIAQLKIEGHVLMHEQDAELILFLPLDYYSSMGWSIIYLRC